MGATLRTTTIHRRRRRREKRLKLRRRLAQAAPGERQAIEARLLKTYPLAPPEAAKAQPAAQRGS